MRSRLTDFMDPNRPLAKAALDLDWTTVVALFPEANRDGYDAARIWVLASILILGEISGLSENEVLSRWPENPYWQAFSGFAQFQWKAPVTHADCLTFRRYVDAPRAARLSSIAQSILQTKPVEPTALEAVSLSTGPSIDDALALRQVHFIQPQPPQPYRAPARSGFQNGIKQAYAKAAAPSPAPSAAAQAVQPVEPKDPAILDSADLPKPSPGESGTPPPAPNTQAASPEETPPAPIPEKPVIPQFAQTYTMLVKKAVPLAARAQPGGIEGLMAPEQQSPSPHSAAFAYPPSVAPSVSPASLPAPLPAIAPPPPSAFATSAPTTPAAAGSDPRALPAGAPQFDTTAPFMRRAFPEEPVTMEVVVTGEAPLRYQWETFDDAKGTATPIEGCNEPTLTVALEASDTVLAFQCRVSIAAYPLGAASRTFFLKKATKPAAAATKNPLQTAKTPAAAQKRR